MSTSRPIEPLYAPLMEAAETAIAERPAIDPDMIREIFHEVAITLHDSLAIDDLDEHDAREVVAGLCVDLLTADPGAALRARARSVAAEPGDVHDPEATAAAYLTAAQVMQI